METDVPAVSVTGLTKRYGGVAALDGVDLAVAPGTVHGLLGPNGAGKTTLLRVLLGLVAPDAGSVRVLGRDPADGSAALDGVGGFVETPACWPYLTGRRALVLLARLDASPAVTPDEALAAVGLLARADERVGGWSLGMRQRLGVAAALLRARRLLVVDEPGNGLDPVAARDLRDLLARLAAQGTAVLLSSHDMGEVEQLCRTVTVVRGGRVAFDGGLGELRGRAPRAAVVLRTSDDRTARAVVLRAPGVTVDPSPDGALRVRAGTEALDALVHALSRVGVAVRELHQEQVALEELVVSLVDPLPRQRTGSAP